MSKERFRRRNQHFLCGPRLVGGVGLPQVDRRARHRDPLLDAQRLQELSPYYAFVILMALTNMEVLRVLPWQEGSATFDGLPDRRMMMRVWLTVVILEDIPQFCLQLVLRHC